MRVVSDGGVDARLTVVGSGEDETKLRQMAKEFGLNDVVALAGEQADPGPYLASADVFVLPSRQEGFSNAILEAMAAALPVIATDVGGNAEAIVRDKGGLIISPEQPDALAAAITKLAGTRDQLPDMGRFNRERAAERFSLEASARNLAEWYFGVSPAREL